MTDRLHILLLGQPGDRHFLLLNKILYQEHKFFYM
jgi:hypothetical protein